MSLPVALDNRNITHIVYLHERDYNINFISINRYYYDLFEDLLEEYSAFISYKYKVRDNFSITIHFKKERFFLAFQNLIKYEQCPKLDPLDNNSRRFMIDFEN